MLQCKAQLGVLRMFQILPAVEAIEGQQALRHHAAAAKAG